MNLITKSTLLILFILTLTAFTPQSGNVIVCTGKSAKACY